MSVRPTGRPGKAKVVYGALENLLVNGGAPFKDKKMNKRAYCRCTPPSEVDYGTGERTPVCIKGESCEHTVVFIINVLVSLGWNEEQIYYLAVDRKYRGLAWLRVNMHKLSGYVNFARKRAIQNKKKYKRRQRWIATRTRNLKAMYGVATAPNFVFEIRYEVLDRMCDVLEQYPGINFSSFERMMTSQKFQKRHFRIYLKEMMKMGILTLVDGTNNQCHIFLHVRPAPPEDREFREINSWESLTEYNRLYKNHWKRHPEWIRKYNASVASMKKRQEEADMFLWQQELKDRPLSVEEFFLLLDYEAPIGVNDKAAMQGSWCYAKECGANA